MKSKVRVLGIDPGLATIGWGILEKENGLVKTIDYGQIETFPENSISERLLFLGNDLMELITEFQPDEVAVEELFYFKNKKTIISVGQARGVILYVCKSQNLVLGEYTPLQVKQALTGYGKADKKQVQIMIKNVLKLKEVPKPDDVADALAVGLCHLNSRDFKEKLEKNKTSLAK